MSDRLFFPLAGLVALGLVALALVWPQGLGARSPGPFGHAPVQQAQRRAAKAAPPPVLGIAPSAPPPASAAPAGKAP